MSSFFIVLGDPESLCLCKDEKKMSERVVCKGLALQSHKYQEVQRKLNYTYTY